MNTYLRNTDHQRGEDAHLAVRAGRSYVRDMEQVKSGKWVIVPATAALRSAARIGVTVKTYRILSNGSLGLL